VIVLARRTECCARKEGGKESQEGVAAGQIQAAFEPFPRAER
jgi:hypothetical protein